MARVDIGVLEELLTEELLTREEDPLPEEVTVDPYPEKLK